MYPENWTGDEDRMRCQEEMERRSGAMSTPRQQSSAACTARVALEALKGLQTVQAFASTSGVHPTPRAHGQHRLPKERPAMGSARRAKRAHDQEAFAAPVSQPIGPRQVALAWREKKLDVL